MSNSKKYGLILPEKTKRPVFQASRNVFGNDSESDDESSKKAVLLRPSDNINRQAKVSQEKAIMEDPTVYQYDEIYDSITIQKEKKVNKTKEEKKPQYIENLMKAASKRKIENERRIERQIQKEREKEGEEFKDKEVFVTSAYKKKLEEMRLEEEKEKREEYLESIGDVTKQKDLGGFYRHLYEQQLGSDKNIEVKQDANQKEVKENNEHPKHPTEQNKTLDKLELKRRNYRKRKLSSDHKKHLSEGEIDESDEEINRVNLEDIKKFKQNKENIDADSDFSIDESSDEEVPVKKIETDKLSLNEETFIKPIAPHTEKEQSITDSKNKNTSTSPTQQEVVVTEQKPKIDIWKKRTVGEIFQQALKRYYERKASRGN